MARDDTVDPSRRSLFGLRPKPVKTREKLPDIPIADVAPEPPNLPATVPEGPSPQTENFLQRASQAPAQNVSPKVQGLIGKVTQVPVDRRTLMRGAASVAVNASRVGKLAGKMLPKATAPIEHAPLKEIVHGGPLYSKDAIDQMIQDQLESHVDDFMGEHDRDPTEEEYEKIKKTISEDVEKNPYEYDDWGRDGAQYADGPKYHPDVEPDMSLPGGENYREVMYKLERKKEELPKGWTVKYGELPQATYHKGKYWSTYSPDGALKVWADSKEKAIENTLRLDGAHPAFHSSMWDGEPDILAGARLIDRNIPGVGKTLHIEELGSEWHMEGKAHGYGKIKELPKGWTVKPAGKNYIDGTWGVRDQHGSVRAMADSKEAVTKNAIEHYNRNNAVPDAPLKETWSDEAMRRVVKRAIEEGYDAVSWTPGEHQIPREGKGHAWSLSNKEHEKFVRDLYDTKMVKQAQEMAREFGGKVEYKMLPVGHPENTDLTPEDFKKIEHWRKEHATREKTLAYADRPPTDDPILKNIKKTMDKIREHSRKELAEGRAGLRIPVLRLPKTGWKLQTSD